MLICDAPLIFYRPLHPNYHQNKINYIFMYICISVYQIYNVYHTPMTVFYVPKIFTEYCVFVCSIHIFFAIEYLSVNTTRYKKKNVRIRFCLVQLKMKRK